MPRVVLGALKETYSSRRDLAPPQLSHLGQVSNSKLPSLDKALERTSISRGWRLHPSLSGCGLTRGDPICSRRAFGLFMPRDLFQFPDCCAAGGWFSSFNLGSGILRRKRGSLHKEWMHLWRNSLLKNPGAWGRIFCWEVSVSLLCPSPPPPETGRIPQFRGCPGTVWTPCCLRIHLAPFQVFF